MTKLSLHQKLIEIRKSVTYLQKATSGHKYKYVQESDVLTQIRPRMDELGVLLIQNMESCELIDAKLCIVTFSHTWVDADNPEDKISTTITLSGFAGDPKVVGGMSTYASKYHLFKFLNIPMDQDDPDAHQTKVEQKSDPYISDEQIEMLDIMINGDTELKANMLKFCGQSQKEEVSGYAQIRARTFKQCLSCLKARMKKQNQESQAAQNEGN